MDSLGEYRTVFCFAYVNKHESQRAMQIQPFVKWECRDRPAKEVCQMMPMVNMTCRKASLAVNTAPFKGKVKGTVKEKSFTYMVPTCGEVGL